MVILTAPLAAAPDLNDALKTWLDQRRALDAASDNTINAYRRDVSGFFGFLCHHFGERACVQSFGAIGIRDMRSWMAFERARGLSARSLARALSAVKSFCAWLAEREGFDPTAILSTRSPKFEKKLPRPLSEDAAKAMIETVELQSMNDWVAARDMAVVTMLYGCGLRISEALGLTGADFPLPKVLRIDGKGGKERVVPVIPAA